MDYIISRHWKTIALINKQYDRLVTDRLRAVRYYARPERMIHFKTLTNLTKVEFVTRMQVILSEHLNLPHLESLSIFLEGGGSVHWDCVLPELSSLSITCCYQLDEDDSPFIKTEQWVESLSGLKSFTCNISNPWVSAFMLTKNDPPQLHLEHVAFFPGDYSMINGLTTKYTESFFRWLLQCLDNLTNPKSLVIPVFRAESNWHITDKMVAIVASIIKKKTCTLFFSFESHSAKDLIEIYTGVRDPFEHCSDQNKKLLLALSLRAKTRRILTHQNSTMSVNDDHITMDTDVISELAFMGKCDNLKEFTSFKLFIRPHTVCYETSSGSIQQVMKEWCDKIIFTIKNICRSFTLDVIFMSVSASQINTFGEARNWSDHRRELIDQYSISHRKYIALPKFFISDLKPAKFSTTLFHNRVFIKSKDK